MGSKDRPHYGLALISLPGPSLSSVSLRNNSLQARSWQSLWGPESLALTPPHSGVSSPRVCLVTQSDADSQVPHSRDFSGAATSPTPSSQGECWGRRWP